MAEVDDYNAHNIAEFRAHDGKLGGNFEGAPMLLLHSIGAKSGQEQGNPMMYQAVGHDYAVFASKAGAPTNPDWYHNLVAHPDATIEVGTETFEAEAVEVTGEDREVVWKRIVAPAPGFGEYQKRTDRILPVIALTRAD